jgi:hypothetical protein
MIRHIILAAGILIHAPVMKTGKMDEKKMNVTYSDWEEVRNTGGVKTFVRWLYNGDGTKTRERKGEILTDCNLKTTIGLLTDASATKEWMSGVSENYVLSHTNPKQWYTYTLYNIPWPFNKRDLVSSYELKNTAENKSATITINSKAGYIPEKHGIARLKSYNATWTITETSSHQVFIVFNAMSDSPPLFPRYIQDPVIEKMFHNNLIRLKDLLTQKAQSK